MDGSVRGVVEALALLDRAVRECRSASMWAWPDAAVVAALDRAQALAARLAAVQLALVREVDARGVAAAQGASGTGAWLAGRYRTSPAAANRQVRLAAALDGEVPAAAEALAAGEVNVEQAQVIAAAVAGLPAEHRAAAEKHLVSEAATFGPRELGMLGRRVFEVVAPDAADAQALAALQRAEERAYRGREVRLVDVPGEGRVRLTGWLDREAAAIVRAALDPLCAPRADRHRTDRHRTDRHRTDQPGTDRDSTDRDSVAGLGDPDDTGRDGPGPGRRHGGDGGRRTPGQRRADALVEVCRLATACTALPDNGGDRPQVVVTIGYTALRDGVAAATLDDGSPLSPAAARRLACDAGILPAVLNGPGQILDLGRERRLFTGPLRRALILRDKGCAFPGCDRPPRWCDGHHLTHWADGGTTSLHNAVLLCGHHHRLVHHSDWQVRINPTDGRPEFLPPAYLDPTRHPRRNHYHHRE
ncbi:DUF222 domain-containing protein [Planosporangium sp. 12N6]|uniref:HNH endonuclease signature motif containing protein n=1 Tax=Planosporangium spinosum TaxID=3402278 RepID=UPI003CF60266